MEVEKSMFGTVTLGGLTKALESVKPDATVQFDFCYLRPTVLDSYRGYYDHLALGWSSEAEPDGEYWPKASDVLSRLKQANGATFTGWKGGDFCMNHKTPVWVANPGEAGDTGIVDVLDEGHTVTLVTAKVD